MADKFRAQLREVASTTNTSTRNVIGQQVADASNELLQRMPRKSASEQTVRRKRRRTEERLANPVSLNFDIPRKHQHIVLYDSGPEDPRRILALGHTDLVPFLGGDLVFGDGTFDVTPLFFQLHTIHCQHLKALVFLYAFEESVDCHLLSSFCDDSIVHISLFKYVLSTMGVSKESITKFLIGNRLHVKLRILSPENCKQSLQVKS